MSISKRAASFRALENIGDLLVVMLMARNDAALFEIDMSQHHPIACDHPAFELLGEVLLGHRFPPVEGRFTFLCHCLLHSHVEAQTIGAGDISVNAPGRSPQPKRRHLNKEAS